jgi:predicted dehydrogenase
VNDKPVGVAIVGCGWVAPAHAAAIALTPGARLVAAVDSKIAAAEQLVGRFGGEASVSLDAALNNPDVSAISVCLPQALHHDIAVRALACGKHVLCEKPMAMTTAECQAMIEAAGAASRQLGVVFNYRYSQVARAARDLVARGAVGDVRSVLVRMNLRESATYPPPAAWRESPLTTTGGILTHRVIHVLDFLVLLVGEARQTAAVLVDDEKRLEHTAAVTFGFEGGAVGSVVATTSAADPGTRIEINGSRGRLVLGDTTVELDGDHVPLPTDIDVPEALRGSLLFGTGHVWVMRDFIEAVLRDTPPPVSGVDGLRLQRVLDGIYTASRSASASEGARVYA